MAHKKKIAFFVSTLAGGGAQRFVANLATEFSTQGHEVHIFLQHDEIVFDLPENIQIHALTPAKRTPGYRNYSRLRLANLFRREINKQSITRNFDLIISTMFGANSIARLSGVPHIIYRISNNLDRRLRKGSFKHFYKKFWMHLLFKNQNIVVLNQEMKQHVSSSLDINPANIFIIPSGYNFEYIKKMATQPESEVPSYPYILHVGRYQEQKRHDVLLKAYKHANIPHKLVLLGQGRPKATAKLNALIDELGLSEKIIKPGFQENPYPWIKNASLVVISSDYEGLSNVLIEALILGTPVVSTLHISGPKDVMTGELTEYLSEIGNPQALGENIKKAIQHYPEISPDIYERFNVEHIAGQYLDRFCEHKS